MKNKVLISLFVLVILLLANTFLLKGTKEQKEFGELLFSDIKKEQITALKIIKDSSTVDLIRSSEVGKESPILKKSNWLLRQSGLIPASEEVVEDIVTKILAIRAEKQSDADLNGISEADLGLTPPDVFMLLEKQDGNKTVISFGIANPVTHTRYMQIEGIKEIYKYQGDFLEFLETANKGIRSNKVLRIDPNSVVSIEVLEGDNYFKLHNKPCDSLSSWSVTSANIEDSIDEVFLKEKIAALSNISVSQIYESPGDILSFTGLDNPKLILTLKLKDQEAQNKEVCSLDEGTKEVILQFGKGIGAALSEKQFFFLKISGRPVIYELERSFIGDWLQGADHFRIRKPLESINRKEVKTLSISGNISGADISCSYKLDDSSKSNQVLGLFSEFGNSLKFDAILKESEINAYQNDLGFDVTVQIGSEVRIVKVVKKAGTDAETYSSILEFKKDNKPSYYGSISSLLKSDLEKYLLDICKVSSR